MIERKLSMNKINCVGLFLLTAAATQAAFASFALPPGFENPDGAVVSISGKAYSTSDASMVDANTVSLHELNSNGTVSAELKQVPVADLATKASVPCYPQYKQVDQPGVCRGYEVNVSISGSSAVAGQVTQVFTNGWVFVVLKDSAGEFRPGDFVVVRALELKTVGAAPGPSAPAPESGSGGVVVGPSPDGEVPAAPTVVSGSPRSGNTATVEIADDGTATVVTGGATADCPPVRHEVVYIGNGSASRVRDSSGQEIIIVGDATSSGGGATGGYKTVQERLEEAAGLTPENPREEFNRERIRINERIDRRTERREAREDRREELRQKYREQAFADAIRYNRWASGRCEEGMPYAYPPAGFYYWVTNAWGQTVYYPISCWGN